MKKIIALMCAALFLFGGTYAMASTSFSEPQTFEKKKSTDKNDSKKDTKKDNKTDNKNNKNNKNNNKNSSGSDNKKSDTSKK